MGFSTENLCWSMLQNRTDMSVGACHRSAEMTVNYPYSQVMAANVILATILPAALNWWNHKLDQYDAPDTIDLGPINFKLRTDPNDAAIYIIGMLNIYAFTMSELVPYVYTHI